VEGRPRFASQIRFEPGGRPLRFLEGGNLDILDLRLLLAWRDAKRSEAILWRREAALHHLQPLSKESLGSERIGGVIGSWRFLKRCGAASVRGAGLSRDARAFSPADERTASGESFVGDAECEAALCAEAHAAAQAAQQDSRIAMGERADAGVAVATTLLRLQYLDGAQTGGEITLYASQSGEAGLGARA
jgi:hypothetical protein